jgi:hypothetical protein
MTTKKQIDGGSIVQDVFHNWNGGLWQHRIIERLLIHLMCHLLSPKRLVKEMHRETCLFSLLYLRYVKNHEIGAIKLTSSIIIDLVGCFF